MRVNFQDHEVSRKAFRKSGLTGEKLKCRSLFEPFWFSVDDDLFLITEGFWWDGSSNPRATWTLIGSPWDEDLSPGAIVHDMLYGARVFPRRKCDAIFESINEMNEMNIIQRKTMDYGLFVGGGFVYNNKTDEQIAGCRKHLLINGRPFKQTIEGV